jgi:kynureninase
VNLRDGFSRFHGYDPDRLHFAAHSHHPWPDVSHQAHEQAWLDAAKLVDDKWDHVFGTVMPRTRGQIAEVLGLDGGETITIAPNTHEFVVRLFSCFDPPVRILTTDSEFHSFSRQARRWEEAGLAVVDRVPVEPFGSFAERFTHSARSGPYDLIYLSHVMFNSGFVVPELDRLVSSVSDEKAFVVIDGYHAFMALPVDLGAIQDRVFYVSGGYKYAMSGEGVCFMHCPPGYGPRPVNTGWYAGFGQLESGVGDQVGFADDASRFAGATFDPSGVYRMSSVLSWLDDENVTVGQIHDHVVRLQRRFLDGSNHAGDLVLEPGDGCGNFLTFQTPDAGDLYRSLHGRGVITDYRRDRLRLGFGVYQDESDVDRLIARVGEIATS